MLFDPEAVESWGESIVEIISDGDVNNYDARALKRDTFVTPDGARLRLIAPTGAFLDDVDPIMRKPEDR